ncbi:MAG: hypothetical protein IJY23_06895 [Clostridia bacterium]|nr:hypothetical protein [Clostridia bacterium]
MLGKLLKHDMRSMSKVAAPMFIASGIVSVICCAMLYFTFGFFEEDIHTVFGAIMLTGSFYLIGLGAIFVMWAIVSFLAIARYYKSLFTDEGYLNMVLPIKSVTLFSAKLLSTFIWIAFASGVAVLGTLISVVLPTLLYDSSMVAGLIDTAKVLLGLGEDKTALVITIGIVKLAESLVSSVESIIIIITAVTVGATLINRHKVFGSIIFYFVITLAEEIFSGVATLVFESVLPNNLDISAFMSSLFALILSAGISVGMYFLSLFILEKKFNIE